MNSIYKFFLVLVVSLMVSFQFVIAQVSPSLATGIYRLSSGNELRLRQTVSNDSVLGNLVNDKKKVLAQFEGNYNYATGKLEGVLIHCDGWEEELLWYFSRNKPDRAEVYLGTTGQDTKAVASRIPGNPLLDFPCKTSRRKVKKIIRDSARVHPTVTDLIPTLLEGLKKEVLPIPFSLGKAKYC